MISCLLCGWIFDDVRGRRVKRTEALQEMVRRMWVEGPFVYKTVMGHKEPYAICCATCLKHRGRGTTMLPMDEFLLSLLVPGFGGDMRRSRRMRHALLRTVDNRNGRWDYNPYACPRYLYDLAARGVGYWWERNLKTNYFRHKATAREIRVWGRVMN